MTPDNDPDPIAEGLGHGAQRTAQLIALAAMTANGVHQFANQRHDLRAARDERAREAAEQEFKAALDGARSRWAPAHDRDLLRRATLLETARPGARRAAFTIRTLTCDRTSQRQETAVPRLRLPVSAGGGTGDPSQGRRRTLLPD
jgi:hypothetical protein